jgi:hypothetical protein
MSFTNAMFTGFMLTRPAFVPARAAIGTPAVLTSLLLLPIGCLA